MSDPPPISRFPVPRLEDVPDDIRERIEAVAEKTGFVPNVVFPTGIVQQGENVLVYYGAADTCTAVVEFSLREIVNLANSERKLAA